MRTHRLDNYLRTHRKRSGFSQETLSYLLGAENGTKVSRYERNDRVPNFDTILALVAVFGEPMEELFAGRFGKVRTKIRRRAAYLRRRLAAHPQSYATRRRYIERSLGGPEHSEGRATRWLAALLPEGRH